MNDDQFDDLKQFIEATVSQSEARLRQEMGELRQEMRDGFVGVGEAFAPANDQIEDHEQRITKLEGQTA